MSEKVFENDSPTRIKPLSNVPSGLSSTVPLVTVWTVKSLFVQIIS